MALLQCRVRELLNLANVWNTMENSSVINVIISSLDRTFSGPHQQKHLLMLATATALRLIKQILCEYMYLSLTVVD